MKKQCSEQHGTADSRRRFLRQGVIGATLFGLGSALGLWAPASSAQPAAKKSGSSKLGSEYSYDIDKLRQTDPRLLLYEEAAPFNPGLKEIRALQFAPDYRLYVAGDRAVVVLSPQGSRVAEVALSEPPRCLGVANNGRLYVGLKNRIEVYASGVLSSRWEVIPSRPVITAVAVAEKEIFVADAGNRAVWRYDLNGKQTGRIGLKEGSKTASRFIVPSPYFDLAIGPGNLLWVANPGQHRLEAFTFDGALEASWGETSLQIAGFCGCCNPVFFTLLPDGRFVTSEKGLTRVKVYSPKGEFECVVAGPEQFPKYGVNPDAMATGLDVAADGQGRVFVADGLAGQVRVFTRKPKV
jgi:hypothetical protein